MVEAESWLAERAGLGVLMDSNHVAEVGPPKKVEGS
jgi:hypothetical protein